VVDPDGYIRIVDRIKDIVVTGGEKVPSVEVEAIIMTHPAVQDVAVVGKPDHRWGEIVKAVVKAKDGSSVTEQDIILWCRSRMAGFKTPREVEFAEIPRTATGKIQKNVLKKRELEWQEPAEKRRDESTERQHHRAPVLKEFGQWDRTQPAP